MESEVEGNGSVACRDQSLALQRPVRGPARKPVYEQDGGAGAVVVIDKANTVCGSNRLFMTSQLRLLGQ
jgi:hypothetical protein